MDYAEADKTSMQMSTLLCRVSCAGSLHTTFVAQNPALADRCNGIMMHPLMCALWGHRRSDCSMLSLARTRRASWCALPGQLSDNPVCPGSTLCLRLACLPDSLVDPACTSIGKADASQHCLARGNSFAYPLICISRPRFCPARYPHQGLGPAVQGPNVKDDLRAVVRALNDSLDASARRVSACSG